MILWNWPSLLLLLPKICQRSLPIFCNVHVNLPALFCFDTTITIICYISLPQRKQILAVLHATLYSSWTQESTSPDSEKNTAFVLLIMQGKIFQLCFGQNSFFQSTGITLYISDDTDVIAYSVSRAWHSQQLSRQRVSRAGHARQLSWQRVSRAGHARQLSRQCDIVLSILKNVV